MLGKPLNRKILDKEASHIYGELKQTLTYLLNSQDTKSTEMKKNLDRHSDLMTCMNIATYLQKMELIGSMLGVLTITFAIFLCVCHMKIISAVTTALIEI